MRRSGVRWRLVLVLGLVLSAVTGVGGDHAEALVPPPTPLVQVGSYLQPLYVNIVEAGGQTAQAVATGFFGTAAGVAVDLTPAILLVTAGDGAQDGCGYQYGTVGDTACKESAAMQRAGGYPPFSTMTRDDMIAFALLYPSGDRIAHAPFQRAFCQAMISTGAWAYANTIPVGGNVNYPAWAGNACPAAFMQKVLNTLGPGQTAAPTQGPVSPFVSGVLGLSPHPVTLISGDSSMTSDPNNVGNYFSELTEQPYRNVQPHRCGPQPAGCGQPNPPTFSFSPDLTGSTAPGDHAIALTQPGDTIQFQNSLPDGAHLPGYTVGLFMKAGAQPASGLAECGSLCGFVTLFESSANGYRGVPNIRIQANGTVALFEYMADWSSMLLTSGKNVLDGQPHAIVVQGDDTTGTFLIRVDGVEVARRSGVLQPAAIWSYYGGTVGFSHGFGGDFYRGDVDGVTLFPRVLTAPELAKIEAPSTPGTFSCPDGFFVTSGGEHNGDCAPIGTGVPLAPPTVNPTDPVVTIPPAPATEGQGQQGTSVTDGLLHLGDRILSGLASLAGTIVNGLRSVLEWGFNLLASLLRVIISWLQEIARLLGLVVGGLGQIVGALASGFSSLLSALTGMTAWLSAIWTAITGLAAAIGTAVVSGLSTLLQGIIAAVQAVAGAVVSGLTALLQGIITAVQALGTLVQAVLQAVQALASAIVNGILNGLAALFVPQHLQDRANEVGTAYNSSGVPSFVAPVTTVAQVPGAFSTATAGCAGPTVTLPQVVFGGYVWHPLDACSGPMQTLANAFRLGLSALVFLGALFFYYRTFMTVSGLGVGLDGAEAAT